MAHLSMLISPVTSYDAQVILAAATRIAGPTTTASTMKLIDGGRQLAIHWTGGSGTFYRNIEVAQRIQLDLTRRGIKIFAIELDGQHRNPNDVWEALQ